MNNWERIDTQDRDGFTIKTYIRPEDFAPDFDDEEVIEGINEGLYLWFQVMVTASKADVELGREYLGGCCYEDAMDFIRDGDYWEDMVAGAIAEARNVIEELKK